MEMEDYNDDNGNDGYNIGHEPGGYTESLQQQQYEDKGNNSALMLHGSLIVMAFIWSYYSKLIHSASIQP